MIPKWAYDANNLIFEIRTHDSKIIKYLYLN